MDLEKEILAEHSKCQSLKIADYIAGDPGKFSILIDLFLYGGYRTTQRSSWIVSICADKYPHLIFPHLEKMVLNLKNQVHNAVKRNTLRILQNIEVPHELEGLIVDICFQFLSSKSEPVAVKVFSMAILYNISVKEPDLGQELIFLIEDQLPYESAAFRSRGTKILNMLKNKKRAHNRSAFKV